MEGYTVIPDDAALKTAIEQKNVYVKNAEGNPEQVKAEDLTTLTFEAEKYYTKNQPGAEGEGEGAAAAENAEQTQPQTPAPGEGPAPAAGEGPAAAKGTGTGTTLHDTLVNMSPEDLDNIENIVRKNMPPSAVNATETPAQMLNINNEPGSDPDETPDADKKYIYKTKEEVDKARKDQGMDPLPVVGGRRTRRRNKKSGKKSGKKSRRQSKKGGKKHRNTGSKKSKKSRRYSSRK